MQFCFNKIFFFNKFYLFSYEQGFGNSIKSFSKFFYCKLNVSIIENKKKNTQDHFHTNVGYQKDLSKKSRLISKLIIDFKAS